MFEPTVPFGEPELMRASAYQLYLKELEAETTSGGVSSRISSLSPSLRADLYRFEADGGTSEVLEVFAACVRHAKRVTVHAQHGEHVLPLTVFPHEQLVHCPITFTELLGIGLTGFRVLHVEPARLSPPGEAEPAFVGEPQLYFPLAPLLWELALRGERSQLLPEIAGPAVYRMAPGLALGALPLSGALQAAVHRLRHDVSNLRDMAEWPGMDREQASRLLNALYLQAGLMVSRSHPGARRLGPAPGLPRR